MAIGKSIRLFLADGTPGGLLTAEIMNWTGLVVAAPRSELAAVLKRDETRKTGIYILLGDDPGNLGGQMAYIGEGDVIGTRLYQHNRAEAQGGKDFWNRAILLTSKDANLTKAHVRYLESRLISIAQEAGRVKLTNGTAPQPIALPEADQSDMEYFVEQAKIVLPVLGVNILRSVQALPGKLNNDGVASRNNSPVFEMTIRRAGIRATARVVDGEFTVLQGSRTRLKWTGVKDHSYMNLLEQLVEDGTLVPAPDNESLVFTKNRVFSSPSAAAATVAGRTSNGRIDWVEQGTKRTYGQWESDGADEAMVP